MRQAPVFRPLESSGALEIDKNIALDLPESSVHVFVCWSNAMVQWKYSGEISPVLELICVPVWIY